MPGITVPMTLSEDPIFSSSRKMEKSCNMKKQENSSSSSNSSSSRQESRSNSRQEQESRSRCSMQEKCREMEVGTGASGAGVSGTGVAGAGVSGTGAAGAEVTGAGAAGLRQRLLSSNSSMRPPWLLPQRWMLPRMFETRLELPTFKDSHLLSLQEDGDKMEISLDTTGYTPEELKVQVVEGELCVEGRHEERSEGGQVMVSRQFQRRYGLPQGARREGVQSNLSQDGVMVITVPKEEKITEVKQAKHVEHVNKDRRQGRVDAFPGPGEMQARRRSLSEAGRERAASGARGQQREAQEDISRSHQDHQAQQDDQAQQGHQAHQVQSAESHQANKSHQSQAGDTVQRAVSRSRSSSKEQRSRDFMVPMTMRDPFLDDPFFAPTLLNIENTWGDFFQQARSSFEERVKEMEGRMRGELTLEHKEVGSLNDRDWMAPIDSMMDTQDWMKLMDNHDSTTIEQKEDETQVEVELDTAGYKPCELKVEVNEGVVRVEGKHEEKSEAGHVMVSRQFSRSYALPAGARAEDVESSLSEDGRLVVRMNKPRREQLQGGAREVNIVRHN